MQEHRLVVSRTITSGRFSPVIEKSIRERIEDFAEVRQLLSLYPFSADYAVKAAMGGSKRTGGARNPAADNKAKRQKELNFRRLGTYCFDPKATRKPNQYFETKPRFNLDGQMGDVANVGWLDVPKAVEPENLVKRANEFYASQAGKPKIIARAAKINKRTGQLEAKALGQPIGRAAGNIGQAAARAIGIVLDPSGRMRCPPGVPAANQFTDEIGSNCFDFTPAIGRAVMNIVRRATQSIIDDVNKIDGALPIVRNEDGSISEVSAETASLIRGGLRSSTGTIRGPRGELLGPDGMPIRRPEPSALPDVSPDFERDVADIASRSRAIPPEEYEEVFEAMIRRAYPELSRSEIKRLTQQAVRRQRMKDKQRADVKEVLDFASSIGIEIDPTDPNSVQDGLAKVLNALKQPENGAWDINLKSYFGNRFGSGDMSVAMLEHKARQLESIINYAITNPAAFGMDSEEFKSLIVSRFGGSPQRLHDGMLEVLTGMKSIEEVFGSDPRARSLFASIVKKHNQMRMQEAGLLIGLINQRRRNPELTKDMHTLSILDPFDKRGESSDAITYVDPRKNGYGMALNPLATVMQSDEFMGGPTPDYILFEPDGAAGTEVAKLAAITSSLDAHGAARAKQTYLSELQNIDVYQESVGRGDGWQQFDLLQNLGQAGSGMYIMAHEMVHGRQLMLIQNYLKSIPGLTDSMTNEDIIQLSQDLLAGDRKFPSVFGHDWDYSSIISNKDWLPSAVENMPEIMQILLRKNAGGKYAMKQYWHAAFADPFLSAKSTDELYLHLNNLRQKMETMDPNSTQFEQALLVFNQMAQIYNSGDMGKMQAAFASHQQKSALVFAEMQAELMAGIESGLIEMTPEIEAFLGPLAPGRDIPSDFGIVNPDAKPVVAITRESIKEGIKNTISIRKNIERGKRKLRERMAMNDLPDSIPGLGSDTTGDSRRIFDALSGVASRTDMSKRGFLVREAVLDAATEQQKQILSGNWRDASWNTSDPVDWGRALRSRPEDVVNAVENQLIPFMDLIDSSEVPTDTVAEVQLPLGSLGFPGDEEGSMLSVNKHFTAVMHSAEDADFGGSENAERILLLVPEGSTGLPDYTPGTQKGEVGSLIMPPGDIEILGRADDGAVIGKVSSQKPTSQQLNELRQVLHSLGSNESMPLGKRIVAKRAENRIERRQEASRIGRAQAAVAMEMDPRNSRLARQIEYDPQTRTLSVSYRNGHKREFQNVPYGKVRDAGASSSPDKLIRELEDIPQEYNPSAPPPRNFGLASSTVSQINESARKQNARQRTVDILARAGDIGVDIDRQEREIVPRIKEQISDNLKYAREQVRLLDIDQDTATLIRQSAANGMSDSEILRNVVGGRFEDNFASRLSILRAVAEGKGDTKLVSQIDDFVKDISDMSDDEFKKAYEEALETFTSPFDDRPVVLVRDPLAIVGRGRYLTTHEGTRTMGGTNTFDDDTVRNARMATESMLFGFNGDTDVDTQALRPSSGLTMSKHHSEDRAERLRAIYGDGVEIQHNYPTASTAGQNVATTGSGKNASSTGRAYGDVSIILRPETSDRTLSVSGDSISGVSTSGSDVLEPSGKLSNIAKDGKLASTFFNPAAVIFDARTNRKNTIASAAQSNRKTYIESLTLGSFENQDIQAIVGGAQQLRGDKIWRADESTMSMSGVNPSASFTSMIGAARTRDDMLEKYGIDVVPQSRFFDLDEVEPFNASMTEKWVEEKIKKGDFSNVSASDLIPNEKTTPYEALLRYQKRRAENDGEFPVFDHPDNASGFDDASKAKNRANFISMVDEELKRVGGGGSDSTTRRSAGLASSTENYGSETIKRNIERADERVIEADRRVSALEKALDHLEKTGEWRGEDFGVSASMDPNYLGDVDLFDSTGIRNLSKAEVEELNIGLDGLKTKVRKKIQLAKKERVFQEHLAKSKKKRHSQNVLDVEDIPDEELDVLIKEALDMADMEPSAKRQEFVDGDGRTAVVHVGSPELDGDALDPSKTSGVDTRTSSSGNTGQLNQMAIASFRNQHERIKGEVSAINGFVNAVKTNRGKYKPRNSTEANYLNSVFSIPRDTKTRSYTRFTEGYEFDLLKDGPKFFMGVSKDDEPDRYLSAIAERLPERLQDLTKRLEKSQRVIDKIDTSPEFGFLSSYPASLPFTDRGYFGRNAGKAIPKDVGEWRTEYERTRHGGDKGHVVLDDEMWSRWNSHLRGTGWLVPDDGDNITTDLGPGDGEHQILGKTKPIFGFSAPVSDNAVRERLRGRSTSARSEVSLIGDALMARAMRLKREGREITPASVLSARRGKPLPDVQPPRSIASGAGNVVSGLASSTTDGPTKPQYPRKPTYGPLLGKANEIFDGVKTWEDFKKRYEDTEITFIDYETTGLKFDEWNFSNGNGNVVQIGGVKVKNGKVVDRFSTFVNPGMKRDEWEDWSKKTLKDGAGNLLSDDFLADKPSVADAHKQFAKWAGPNAIMGVQNAAFDKDVLDDALRENGIDWSPDGWIDLKDVAAMSLPRWSEENPDGPFKFDKKKKKNVPSNSLADITKYLDVKLDESDHHDASNDAEATAKSLQTLIDRAIEKRWSTDVFDKTKRDNYVRASEEKFKNDIEIFETEKTNWINQSNGLASRTTDQKTTQGPQFEAGGRDDKGMPRMIDPSEADRRFGGTKRAVKKYFKDKYGINVKIQGMAAKAPDTDDYRDLPEEMQTMTGFFSEINGPTAGTLQAIDDALSQVPNLKQLIGKDALEISIQPQFNSKYNFDVGTQGVLIRQQKWRGWAKFIPGTQGQKYQIVLNEDALKNAQLRDIYQHGTRVRRETFTTGSGQLAETWSMSKVFAQFGIPEGTDLYDATNDPDFTYGELSGKAAREKLADEVRQRLAYAVTIHELGHFFDSQARDRRDIEAQRGSELHSEMFFSSSSVARSGEDVSRNIDWQTAPSVSKYGKTNERERMAEAFMAWFLFSGSESVDVAIEGNDKITQFREAMATIVRPLLEKLGDGIKSAKKPEKKDDGISLEDLPPFAVLYALMPLARVAQKGNNESGKIARRRARRMRRNEEKNEVLV